MSLTQREREHLDVALQCKAERRERDADLQNVADWRDWLLCAATNLESGQPQSAASTAARLRELADELVRMSLAREDLAITRGILQYAVLPVAIKREDLTLRRMIGELARGEFGRAAPTQEERTNG